MRASRIATGVEIMSADRTSQPPWARGTAPQGLAAATPSTQTPGPDAAGHVERDEPPLVRLDIAATPAVVVPGAIARLRIELRPDAAAHAHWNNEAGDTQLWLDPPEGWRLDERLHSIANPPEDVSTEPRTFQFELRAPDGVEGVATLRGYALYFVCEDVTGVCMFRRQDFQVRLEARKP